MPRFLVTPNSNSLIFNNSAYVRKNSASVYGSTGYSWEFWVKGTPDSTNFLIGEGDNAATVTKVGIRATNAAQQLNAFIRNSANTTLLNVNTNKAILDGNWHHIVFTDNHGTCVFYIDGIADTANFNYTPSGSFTITDTAVGAIWSNGSSASPWGHGILKQVRMWAVVLTSAQVTALYYQNIKPSTPYLEWLFNEGSGTSIGDNSGNGRTGTLNNSAGWSTDVPSQFTARTLAGTRTLAGNRFLVRDMGTALHINNSNTYVSKASASVYGTTGYSVEFWVRGQPQNNQYLYSEGQSGSNNTIVGFRSGLSASDPTIIFFIRNDASTQLLQQASKAPVFTGTWHHIVWTDNNGVCHLYIDGVEDANSVSNLFNYTPSGVFTINQTSVGNLWRTGTGNFFLGDMNTVRTYTKVLSQADVTQLYYKGIVPDRTKLYFEWLLNEGSGTTATDTSGNSRNGTINGTLGWITTGFMKPRTLVV